MAEITSDVFDIFHPTPVPLRELSAIVISLEIWRCEINKYRSSNTLNEFRPSGELISLKTILVPDFPSVIYPTIEKYVEIFGRSVDSWLWSHYRTVFEFQYDHFNCVLEYFEDFVCDYDGSIHYARTAERMMHCDRFDVDQKFLIACTYCFEDDIRRIWPFKMKNTSSRRDMFSENSKLTYWILFLENGIELTDPPIEECILDKCWFHNGPSLEYFWNLIPSENRLRNAMSVFARDLPSFVRFILPKLDHQQLVEFLREKGCELLYALLKNFCYDEEMVLSTWIHVKNAMTEIAFTKLVIKMVQSEVRGGRVCSSDQDAYIWPNKYLVDDRRNLDNFVQLCIEIWSTASENLKRLAVREITSHTRLFQDVSYNYIGCAPTSREFKFLLAVLSEAAYEQRFAFWYNCWQYLITKTWVEDLDKIMRLCLRDEDEITLFKKNFMVKDKNALRYYTSLLTLTYFDEVNQFVRFLLPEMQAARNFKQKILRLLAFYPCFYDYGVPKSSFNSLVSWCSEGNEEVSKLQLSNLSM
ncbi:uncharacterized protein LOC135847872 [Planococcus citri]|uniref:uncharacterized protein LOC135847872 n=1 Tax=Planococcus citri TaxID=170843 RepID=UPI0031F9D9C5